MNRIFYLLGFCLIISTTSCRKNNADGLGPGKDIELTATEKQKVMADNQFSFNLFKTVAPGNAQNQDLFISPLSVSFAVGMMANGSKGQTQTDIYKTMLFTGFTESDINSYYQKLIEGLPQVDPSASMNVANSIWYRQGFTALPTFLQTNSTYYKATSQALNFDSPSSVQTINNWVSINTKGKIPTIIDAIPSDMMMILINAIYFKDQWDKHFDAAQTAKQNFYLPDNSTVQATFMKGDVNVKSGSDDLAYAIELPYTGKKYSMVMLQPVNGHTMQELVAGLDTVRWNHLVNTLKDNHATLTMPKFKFSYEKTLNDFLKSLGMNLAFDANNADFSRITGARDLYVSEVKHKAFIEVTEEGTEAAAVTSIGFSTTSAQGSYITLDHPFIFMIREVKTGLILFTGIMNNPNETGS